MIRIIAAVLFACFTCAAHAQVTIKDPWVRATVPQQQATGAFMQLTAAHGSRLVEARSTAAKVVEIHQMSMTDNVMRMRSVKSIDLPAGKTVELTPSGYHVMLMGLTAQIKEGDSVALTLVFENKDGKRESIEVKAPARPLTASAGGHSAGGHKGH